MARSTVTASSLQDTLHRLENPAKARILQSFFKTGPGQYGEGDQFLGITVPQQRVLARQFRDLPLPDLKTLLYSPVHEERLMALLILVDQCERATPDRKNRFVDFYIRHRSRVNNWDLVDSSAEKILGPWFLAREKSFLYKTLLPSPVLWDRRIAVLTTFHFIRQGRFSDTLRMARLLLKDREDLMHKAVGWMLREVGKREESVLKTFLDQQAGQMPRTMLRYAIERLSPRDRQRYLAAPR